MSSKAQGKQEPRIVVLPKLDKGNFGDLYTDGADAGVLVSAYGLTPDKWQQDIINVWLARNDKDEFVCTSCGLSVPRQNGKNALLEMRELYGLCAIGEKLLHTAHRVDTARKAFLRLAGFFENINYPELKEMVTTIRRANGQEAIILNNGGSIEFSSRVNGGARGSTYDVVVFDEAQELNDDQMESIMSTMAAAPLGNRQLIFTGTPPSPVSHGTVFKKQRAGALEGTNTHIAWHEWSVEEVGDTSDRARWYDTNPALGIRLDEDFTEAEHNTLTEDGFARERLGWWDTRDNGRDPILSSEKWARCAIDKPYPEDPQERFAFGVKFTADGKMYALSVAIKHPERPTYIQGIKYAPVEDGGLASLAHWIADRKNKCALCVLDGKSNTNALAQKLIDELAFPRKAIAIMSTNEVITSATMFVNSVDEQRIAYVNQPDLTNSAVHAQKRLIGKDGGYGFGDGKYPCALVESASFAYMAVMTTKRNPNRKLRCG